MSFVYLCGRDQEETEKAPQVSLMLLTWQIKGLIGSALPE